MKASTVYTKPVYIFLDFDGVLHANRSTVLAWPYNPAKPEKMGHYRQAFHQSGLLEFTLQRHAPNARVIVSSSWRTVADTMEDLRCELLAGGCNAALVSRMDGMTPVFNVDDESVDPTVGIRLQEILAYINTHDLNDVPCLILDDIYAWFTGKEGLFFPLQLIDGETGLSFKDASDIAGWFTELSDDLKPKNWFWQMNNNTTPKDEPEPELVAA